MKFIDSASITVSAGNGGNGCVGFRREKFIQFGGPNGGDGGDGGSVIIEGVTHINTLSEFRIRRSFSAKNGAAGSGQNKRGRSADDLIVQMPLGTQIYNLETDELIAEVLVAGQKVIVAKGGFHGLGNTRFKSSVNRAPRQFTKGTLGEVRELGLEMMVIADVGLLGLPNAGKSSFISKVSHAKPKVADYPFTTLYPNLGVVQSYQDSFVIADIPGIIEDASIGAGLGLEFLSHLSRTKMLLHILDILPSDFSNPVHNYNIVKNELAKYSDDLAKKPQILAINKIDLIPALDRDNIVAKLIEDIDYGGKFFVISTINNTGIDKLIEYLRGFINDNK